MAPARPPRADLIYDEGVLTGVLVCREEGSEAQAMAMRALMVDAGWTYNQALPTILAARIEPGRWFKTPEREGTGWTLQRAGGWRPRAGATPGVLFRLDPRDVQQRSSWTT